jgi:8-oxo-dGTP diphosphatase
LLRVGAHKGAWAGRLNGIGGHIEAGEDPRDSALREVAEESGLVARDLRLVGSVLIDVGKSPGIGLFVFVGKATGEPRSGSEGESLWVPLEKLGQHPLVEDVPEILPLALRCYQDRTTFTAIYRFNPDGDPVRIFHPSG